MTKEKKLKLPEKIFKIFAEKIFKIFAEKSSKNLAPFTKLQDLRV